MERARRTRSLLQHLLVLVLTAVCLGQSLTGGVPWVPEVLGCLAFLAWYAWGTVRRRQRPTWLIVLTVIWLLLVALSPDNVWISFALWLLAGLYLSLPAATAYSIVVLAVVIGGPWLATGSLPVPSALGPAIGAVFALVVARGHAQLVRDSVERQRLLDSLVSAQTETEALHAELAAAQRAAGAQDERTRLSRDIHDTLAQGFSSIVLLSRAGRSADEQGLRDLVAQIETTAADGLSQAREIVAALAPSDLAEAGLPAALTRLAEALREQTGIDAQVRTDGDITGVPTAIEVALLRTAQGALANVRSHAQASRAVLSLSGSRDEVRLDIVDDGVGFDPTAAIAANPSTGGYGLRAARTRLRELGGALDIVSAPGEGTTLSAHIPLGSVP